MIIVEQFPWRETLLGQISFKSKPKSVSSVRAMVLDTIGPDHPRKDDVLLVSSELVTNAVQHSDEGSVSDLLHLKILTTPDLLIVEVYDPGSLSDAPRIKEEQDPSAEGGRGLYLVSLICEGRWGTRALGHGSGRLVWAALPQTDRAPSAYGVIAARRQKMA
jgi:anti-sigma regulatory factor (Ser/Thr protein kinase)